MILAVALGGCSGSSSGHSGAANATVCESTKVGANGHLPACAAGTVSAAAPGVPADFAGRIQASMALSPDEQAAIAQSNALAAARNAQGSDPIDRGVGVATPPARKRGAR